jgi:hypothetical protein
MSAPIPFLPPVLTTVNEILTSSTIPALEGDQMALLSEYLFNLTDRALRIQIAEIAYCNHEHPDALALFLACAIPLAQQWTERKARILLEYPSDWQLECLYSGAVEALIALFQRGFPLKRIPDAFRRYFYSAMRSGAYTACFKRHENRRVHTIENVDKFPAQSGTTRTAEEVLITRDLLEQICQYPLLERVLAKTFGCIMQLGPELAVTEPHEGIKRRMRTKLMLNVPEIARARGVKPASVWQHLYLARAVVRKAFNGDGKLFLTR